MIRNSSIVIIRRFTIRKEKKIEYKLYPKSRNGNNEMKKQKIAIRHYKICTPKLSK